MEFSAGTTLFLSFLLVAGVGAVAKSAWTTALVGGLVVTSLAVRWLRLGGGSLVMSDTLFSWLFCIFLAAVLRQRDHRRREWRAEQLRPLIRVATSPNGTSCSGAVVYRSVAASGEAL